MPPPTRSRKTPLATHVVAVFLFAQVLFALDQAWSEERLVWFTPYSGQTAFRINLTIGDRPQTTAQLRARYRLPFRGRADLTPEALQRIVVHHETVYAEGMGTLVRMHYSRQRGPEAIWLWPQR